jgi:hypothetical protein
MTMHSSYVIEIFTHICNICKKTFYCTPKISCYANNFFYKGKILEICICSECSRKYKLVFSSCNKFDTDAEFVMESL